MEYQYEIANLHGIITFDSTEPLQYFSHPLVTKVNFVAKLSIFSKNSNLMS